MSEKKKSSKKQENGTPVLVSKEKFEAAKADLAKTVEGIAGGEKLLELVEAGYKKGKLSPFLLAHGHWLTTEHTLIHIRMPFAHHSVYGNPFTGFYHHDIALTDSCNRKDAFSLRGMYGHGLGLKSDEFADSS